VNKLIGQGTAAIAVLVALGWGVPYYIRAQVADQLTVINENAAKDPDIVALETADQVILTRLDALAAGQTRIEGKVDLFAASFMSYLERQSE